MGIFKKAHNMVVMDGSNKKDLCSILVRIGEIVNLGNNRIITVTPLDEKHPTMVVVEYETGLLRHQKLKNELDKLYPGLCIHDVAV